MVGNDIVDLLDPDADPVTHDRRFDARVFRYDERHAIACSVDPAALRWSLWAGKEAAYKLCVRRDPATIFSPIRFAVSLAEADLRREDHRVSGRVEYRGESFTLQLHLRDDWVHAVVSELGGTTAGELIFGARRISPRHESAPSPEYLGVQARLLAIDELANRLDVPASALDVRKQGRLPELAMDGRSFERGAAPILSLSHHGGVVGFASRLPTSSRREHALVSAMRGRASSSAKPERAEGCAA